MFTTQRCINKYAGSFYPPCPPIYALARIRTLLHVIVSFYETPYLKALRIRTSPGIINPRFKGIRIEFSKRKLNKRQIHTFPRQFLIFHVRVLFLILIFGLAIHTIAGRCFSRYVIRSYKRVRHFNITAFRFP